LPDSAATRLRNAVAARPIQVPGAPNALAAKLIEACGFGAAYLSGASLSAGVLAVPDIGLFTLTELAEQVAYITHSAEIPLIVDADTGFGEAVNVERTIHQLLAAGAAAVQLEDQQLPKRCGHLSGKTLVEPEAMCAKLRAACTARGSTDLVIIARTDARGVESFDAAVERARKYVDAGADWIFPEALADRDEFARFAEAFAVPLVANMTEFGKSPLLRFGELADLGYAAVLYPVTLLRAAMKTMAGILEHLKREGTQEALLDRLQTRAELYDLLSYEDYEQRDREYFGANE